MATKKKLGTSEIEDENKKNFPPACSRVDAAMAIIAEFGCAFFAAAHDIVAAMDVVKR